MATTENINSERSLVRRSYSSSPPPHWYILAEYCLDSRVVTYPLRHEICFPVKTARSVRRIKNSLERILRSTPKPLSFGARFRFVFDYFNNNRARTPLDNAKSYFSTCYSCGYEPSVQTTIGLRCCTILCRHTSVRWIELSNQAYTKCILTSTQVHFNDPPTFKIWKWGDHWNGPLQRAAEKLLVLKWRFYFCAFVITIFTSSHSKLQFFGGSVSIDQKLYLNDS